jgi:hypothetical protein
MRPLAALLFAASSLSAADLAVGPIPDAVRSAYSLDPFYRKHVVGQEPLVLGSAVVSDAALVEGAWIVRHMLAGRDDIRKAMTASKTRLVVIAATESTTDIPEHSFLRTRMFWDRRARGLGATPQVPVVSCGEENVLGFVRDPYPSENIVVHEFAHAMHLTGLNTTDPTFDDRLKATFEQATRRKLWLKSYAATNKEEYWAEGVQCWFDDNAPPDALHNHIRTRAQLKEYDAPLAALCKEVFGDGPWRYVRPHLRPAKERTHLAGFDFAKRPRFRWKAYPITDNPIVIVQTSAGDFEITVDVKSHPEAARNFLAICLDGGYHSGAIDTVTKANGGTWLGARVKPKWLAEYSKELTLEKLGGDGTPGEYGVSFVRAGPIGQLRIDITKPTGPVKGLIPIGTITKGREVATKIAAGKATAGTLVEPIDLRRAIRSE